MTPRSYLYQDALGRPCIGFTQRKRGTTPLGGIARHTREANQMHRTRKPRAGWEA